MITPALFIGVVSYEGSRFAVSQGPEGLAAALSGLLSERNLSVVTQVNTEDFHDSRALPVTPALIQESLTAQQRLEDAWVAYVRAGRAPEIREVAGSALRWGLRQWRRVRPPGPGPVRRLINIELSHVDLMRSGARSGAPWILIAEDDAATRDPADCAAGLAVIMADAPPEVAFVNVSESFPLEELGIVPLLTQAGRDWTGPVQRTILTASRPITNTVCAILYRREFVIDLLNWFDHQPLTPVVPIDWKLNRALMEMHAAGRLGPGSCWIVSPAPIDQLSMRQDIQS